MPGVFALILAGGRSRRMGADKALLPLGGIALIDRVAAKLAPQVARIAIAADDGARFAPRAFPVLPDAVTGAGPLGGLLAGLEWAQAGGASSLLSVPCDTPFLPDDLARRLAEAASASASGVALAQSGGRDHFTVALYPVALAPVLRAWLARPEHRAIRDWLGGLEPARIGFAGDPDPFANINTPADLGRAEAAIAKSRR